MNYVNILLALVLVASFATTTLAAAPAVPPIPTVPPQPVLPSPGYSGAQIKAVDAGLITKAEIRDLRSSMSSSEIDDHIAGLNGSPKTNQTEEPTQTEPVESIEITEPTQTEETEETPIPQLDKTTLYYILGGSGVLALILLLWFRNKKPKETEGE